MKKLISFAFAIALVSAGTVFAKTEPPTTIIIFPGWNLVDFNVLDGDSIPKEKIRAAYYLDKDSKEYVGGSFNEFDSKIREKFSSDPSFGDYINSNLPLWVYYDNNDKSILSAKASTFISVPNRELSKGWNFVTFKIELLTKGFEGLAGTCKFESIRLFDSKNQKWVSIEDGSEDYVGHGFAVKVSDKCVMGEKNTLIPTIPALPSN